jgi:hypothetical protein
VGIDSGQETLTLLGFAGGRAEYITNAICFSPSNGAKQKGNLWSIFLIDQECIGA